MTEAGDDPVLTMRYQLVKLERCEVADSDKMEEGGKPNERVAVGEETRKNEPGGNL